MPETRDVLVIGGGIAGMTAANRAAELGKRVVVLEKGTEEKYPSNARFTYGTFHINFNGPLTDEQKLLDIIESATEGTARKDLARSLVKAAPRLMDWLSGEGIALIALGQYHTHVLSPVQRTGAGLYWDGYAGDVLHDGDDAGAQAAIIDYDCVVLDLMLPGRSGFQVLRDIRERDELESDDDENPERFDADGDPPDPAQRRAVEQESKCRGQGPAGPPRRAPTAPEDLRSEVRRQLMHGHK